MSDIEIKAAGWLQGCHGRHFVVLGEVIDLYVMPGPLRQFRVFAYEDRECFFVGESQPTHAAALGRFVRDHYGESTQWSMAA